MWNGLALERHAYQMFLGTLDGLRNGGRNLGGFPFSDTDPSLAIAHHHKRAEIESLATLDDFGDSVDKDDLVLQAQFLRIHPHVIMLLSLELEPPFPRRLGQGLNTTVVDPPAPVKNDGLN